MILDDAVEDIGTKSATDVEVAPRGKRFWVHLCISLRVRSIYLKVLQVKRNAAYTIYK